MRTKSKTIPSALEKYGSIFPTYLEILNRRQEFYENKTNQLRDLEKELLQNPEDKEIMAKAKSIFAELNTIETTLDQAKESYKRNANQIINKNLEKTKNFDSSPKTIDIMLGQIEDPYFTKISKDIAYFNIFEKKYLNGHKNKDQKQDKMFA